MTPGRLGTTARSSRTVPPASPASSSASRSPAASACQRGERRAVARRERRAGRAEARDRVVDRVQERVAVGEVDVGPQRRVGAGDARRVAEARAGRRQPLAAERAGGLGDEDVGDDVRQVRHRGHHPVVGVGVDRGGPGAEAGHEAVQALERDPRRRRRRREVPDGAVEEVLARVRDARRLAARERVAADEALVAVGGDHAALRRADVGDRRSRAAPREDRGDGLGQRAERDARRPRRRRRRARRARSSWASSIAPRRERLERRAGRSRGPCAPSLRRAASPTDPPITPTPTTATIKPRPRLPGTRSCPRRRRPPRPCARTRRSPRCAAAAARRRWPPRAAGAPRR